MRERRELWNKLPKTHQDFIFDYLKNNLKLSETDYENFLFPDFEKTILNGKAMHGMDRAVERILLAISKNEKICVYGDYDCDGVPGTALVRDFFQKINYLNVEYYIPHRHTEGYGLNKEAIVKLNDLGVKLILTIDLGTTNIEEIDLANSFSIDVIVTDHHLPIEGTDGQILPKAYAIINNKQAICNYANKDLCGSGTVYKLVCEVLNTLRQVYDSSDKKVRPSGEMNRTYTPAVRTFSSSEITSNFSWSEFEKQGIKLPQNGYEKWLLDLVAIATILPPEDYPFLKTWGAKSEHYMMLLWVCRWHRHRSLKTWTPKVE
jgi:single-stranded DNA-specific DHH superfamily exonuclease